MKKLLLLLFALPLFVSCSSDNESDDPNAPKITITVTKDGVPVEGAEVRIYDFHFITPYEYVGNGYLYQSTLDIEWDSKVSFYKTDKNGVYIYKGVTTDATYSVAVDISNEYKYINIPKDQSSITVSF